MARGSVEVTYDTVDASRIPDILTEGAALLVDLLQRGVIAAVGERLRIRRQGGYSALDVWLLLWLFYTAGAKNKGVRPFWRVLGPCVKRVAALAGRRSLPSPASLSRALDSVELELLRPTSSWLLTGIAEVDEVMRHPVAKSYDAKGEAWQVFDLDPTVTTLRQRGLPADKDLPEPRRRAEDTGAPGHSGRKRGDLQFRRVTVQHAGSGMWVHAHLSPGNGEGVVDFERALDTIVETCERLEHPLASSVVRMDGEYGNVPWFSACRERKLPFITRLNRPKLYEDPMVLARFRTATWYRVPDSRSGPQRAAADLGVLTVRPDRRTKHPDGRRYEPVRVRVVASIFPHEGKAKRGRTLDGWQVELFAVDLPADAWPAPDAVAAYFGRTGQENRFAQEDRELGLDRIVSYHLPGQELASLVGLSVWNLRVARGFAMAPPPAERPVQRLRATEVDDRVPAAWPRDPVIHRILDELDWAALLAKRADLSWDPLAGVLRCTDGRELTLTTVRRREHAQGRTGIIFRRPTGGCEDCEPRQGCLRSTRPMASKHAELSIPTPIAKKLRARLRLVRTKESARTPTPTSAITPVTRSPGPQHAIESMFLPAAARRAFRAIFQQATLHVDVDLPDPPTPCLTLVANDEAHRQRRRKTWQQNIDRYALPADAKVRIQVAAGPELRAMLGDLNPRRTSVGGTS